MFLSRLVRMSLLNVGAMYCFGGKGGVVVVEILYAPDSSAVMSGICFPPSGVGYALSASRVSILSAASV